MKLLPWINKQIVIVEPRKSYSDQDIINILSIWGAENIQQLTYGFIQASIKEYYVYQLHKFAIIHTKHMDQIKGLPGINVWTQK